MIKSLAKLYSGKVRDLYDIDKDYMLMVASDRLSTFDIILNQTIPNKGIYLTQISLFWFNYFKNIPNHLGEQNLANILTTDELAYAKGRALIVKKLKRLPTEVIIRGYLAGSGYQDYQQSGQICGQQLPPNLPNGAKLPTPIFTPSTKADNGQHDENISINNCIELIGEKLTEQVKTIGLTIYEQASKFALTKGIIIADTKFEFGIDDNSNLFLIDEILTPDCSRFWDATQYVVGANPPSFDKQFVRDYLLNDLRWNKLPPIPNLPETVIMQTQIKYYEIVKKFAVAIN